MKLEACISLSLLLSLVLALIFFAFHSPGEAPISFFLSRPALLTTLEFFSSAPQTVCCRGAAARTASSSSQHSRRSQMGADGHKSPEHDNATENFAIYGCRSELSNLPPAKCLSSIKKPALPP